MNNKLFRLAKEKALVAISLIIKNILSNRLNSKNKNLKKIKRKILNEKIEKNP